jgi:hypothetical protein
LCIVASSFPTNRENVVCRFYGCCVVVGVTRIPVGVIVAAVGVLKKNGEVSGAVGVGVGCTAVTRLNHIQTQNATTAMTVRIPLMMRLVMWPVYQLANIKTTGVRSTRVVMVGLLG